jgi:hypothetical protein
MEAMGVMAAMEAMEAGRGCLDHDLPSLDLRRGRH